jgi:hypothetical protein
MHAVRARHQRHVQAIVDDHPGRRARDAPQAQAYQTGERTGLEMRLPNLNQVNTGRGGGRRAGDEIVAGSRQVGVSAGDHAQHRTHAGYCPSCAGSDRKTWGDSRAGRLAKSAMSSTMLAAMLMSPSR